MEKKLYVDSDVYAEEAGWTFDSKNEYIKLTYDKCFSFELGKTRNENGTFIARKRGEKCPHCGCELVDILVLDGRDERFAFWDLMGSLLRVVVRIASHFQREFQIDLPLMGKAKF